MLRSVPLLLLAISLVNGFPTLDISNLVARNSTSETFLQDDEVLVFDNGRGKYPWPQSPNFTRAV